MVYLWPVIIVSAACGIASAIISKNKPSTHQTRKSFGLFSIIFTLIATELGGGVMLGTSQEAFTAGLYGLLYIIGISIGLFLLGAGFASKMKAMNVENTIDLFTIKYNSPSIRQCASFLSTITICGLLIGQALAAQSLIQALGITNEFIFIAFWSLALIYTIFGGYNSASVTYKAQLVYIIGIFSGIFVYCLFKEPPSFYTNVLLDPKIVLDSSSLDFSTIFASLVMPALYYITDQDFAQPFFDIRSRRLKLFSALGASAFMIIFSLIPIYFGIKAKSMHVTLSDDNSPLIPVLGMLTNEIIVILVVCGIIAALIATIDWYLWSITFSITHDFNLKKDDANTPKIVTLIIGLFILGASYCVHTGVVQMIISSYELYDSCLIVPLLMSYFKTDLKKGSAIGAIIFGLFGFIFVRMVPVPFSGQIISLVLSFVGFMLGGLLDMCLKKVSTLRVWHSETA